MLFVDSLVVIGLATASLGTIHETDGPQERSFWLRNSGKHAVTIQQGYTSCGCTSLSFDSSMGVNLSPGDSTQVTLRFNPQGRGGEFHEMGTVVYNTAEDATRRFVNVSLEGMCVTSEETLMRQYPIRLSEDTWLSANRFDIGRLSLGAKRELSVSVLHRDEGNRKELVPVVFIADDTVGSGLQHIARTYSVKEQGRALQFDIIFDVYIQ